MSKRIFIVGIFVLAFLFLASSSLAQGYRPSPRPTPVRALNEVQLRSCEARQSAIQERMAGLVRMVENMLKTFTSITERVKTFYNEKVVPNGKTVLNYASLVSEIDAKKAIVEADVVAVQASDDEFDCGSGDPKGLLKQFRLDMQNLKTDLKNYRTAIKNLIVAVRGVVRKPRQHRVQNHDKKTGRKYFTDSDYTDRPSGSRFLVVHEKRQLFPENP